MASVRNWVWTLNNYTQAEEEAIATWTGVAYTVYGKEVGENNTPHLQGYTEMKDKVRLSGMKKLNKRAHWEPRRGTQEQAITYCKKDGNFIEMGSKKRQGARTDLDENRQLALEGGMRAVTMSGNLQDIRVCEKFLTYNEEPRTWEPTVYWLWGPTGTGKSRTAREICEGKDMYCKNTDNKWWDGYDRHEAVILDDFRDSWWSITYMLALIDRYEMRVEFKGGTRQFLAKIIVVTSTKPPGQFYLGTGEKVNQLVRRCHEVRRVPEVGGNTSSDSNEGEGTEEGARI